MRALKNVYPTFSQRCHILIGQIIYFSRLVLDAHYSTLVQTDAGRHFLFVPVMYMHLLGAI